MAEFNVTHPTSGVSLTIRGDKIPTKEQLNEIFAATGGPAYAAATAQPKTVPPETQAPMVGNPFRGIGNVAGSMWETAKTIPAAHAQPFNYGKGPLHSLGQEANLAGQVIATPVTAPLAMLASGFPRAAQVLGRPYERPEPTSTSALALSQPNAPRTKSLGQQIQEHPWLGDVANIASVTPLGKGSAIAQAVKVPYKATGAVIKAAEKIVPGKIKPALTRAAQVVENPLKEAGIEGLVPKVKQYVEKTSETIKEDLPGATINEKTHKISRTIADEGLHDYIGNPEQLKLKLRQAGFDHATEAYSAAYKNGEIVTSPVQAGIKRVEEYLAEGKDIPAGNVELIRKQAKVVADDMRKRGYDKSMGMENAFNFKRDLNVNWDAGEKIIDKESARNQVRKLMYQGADNLITDPKAQLLLEKSYNALKAADVLKGQTKAAIGIKDIATAAIAPTSVLAGALGPSVTQITKHIPGEMMLPAGVGLAGLIGGYQAVKSGQLGRRLLNLSELGGTLRPKPAQDVLSQSQMVRLRDLGRTSEAVVPMTKGGVAGRGYIQLKPGASPEVTKVQGQAWKKTIKKINKKGGK